MPKVLEVLEVLGFKSLRILPTIKKHLFFLDEYFDWFQSI